MNKEELNKLDTFNKDKFKCSKCKLFFDKSTFHWDTGSGVYYCMSCIPSEIRVSILKRSIGWKQIVPGWFVKNE